MDKRACDILVENVKILRKQKGLSQPALAEKCKLSSGIVGELECGRVTNPSLDTIEKLAHGLSVPIEYLLTERQNNGISLKSRKQQILDLVLGIPETE